MGLEIQCVCLSTNQTKLYNMVPNHMKEMDKKKFF